jgi:hypothetical protein
MYIIYQKKPNISKKSNCLQKIPLSKSITNYHIGKWMKKLNYKESFSFSEKPRNK